uniref:Uncharacterized protein n=1 Tax=Strongyloides papillosus TaxID=174720 RepID=A0A0N5B5M7_STREA
MVKQDSYYYFTISGLPLMVTPKMIGKYIESKDLKYTQVQPFNFLGAFRIVGYYETDMIVTESHFKGLKGELKIDGIKYLFFFSEHKQIKLLLNLNIDVPELGAYFIRHQLPVPNIFKAGIGLCYLTKENANEILAIDYHLQQLNGALVLPVNGQMSQFLRNDDIPPNWEDEAIHREPFNRYDEENIEVMENEEEEIERITEEIIAKLNEKDREKEASLNSSREKLKQLKNQRSFPNDQIK